ncbi:hypothetical protein QVD17_23223 [Tagetes erecta]|uniref:Uncharacterized protein n=1 Tax=Tagetes erecta TaxID=13708 RepID=A0AAD8KGW0_TARER|nr:hypothetical protein QVD17_23223 [Tagetes erecta]
MKNSCKISSKEELALEYAYLAAENKVTTIFDAAESVKEQFYHANENVSRKCFDEPVSALCDSSEKVKVEFESLARSTLRGRVIMQLIDMFEVCEMSGHA